MSRTAHVSGPAYARLLIPPGIVFLSAQPLAILFFLIKIDRVVHIRINQTFLHLPYVKLKLDLCSSGDLNYGLIQF